MTFENQQAFYRWCTGTKAGKEHARAAEAASDLDAAWFNAHPSEEFYVRAPVPGEFPPIYPGMDIQCVLVHQVGPGVRIRAPFERLKKGGKQ